MRKIILLRPKDYLQDKLTFVSNNDKYILICPKHIGLDHKENIKIIIDQ